MPRNHQAVQERPFAVANVAVQSPASNRHADIATLSAFPTPLGWMGLLGAADELVRIYVGFRSTQSVRAAAELVHPSVRHGDWSSELRSRFEAYAEGELIDFADVQIRLPAMTLFRQQIIAATRRLGYGETASYGELARRVGHPGAARAVGTAMSTNRFPILIPCHRVLAAGGKLGGYTAPSGTDLKQRLLKMEARGR